MTAVSLPGDGRTSQADDSQLSEHQKSPIDTAPVWQSRLGSPVWQGGIAFLIYLAVWLPTGFRQIVSHLARMGLAGASQDPNIFVWSLRWWPYAIAHGINPLYTHELLAPTGHSLAWVTTVPPLALLAAPLTLVAGPVVSFNLLATLSLPLAGWGAFILCRRLTGKFWAGLAGGAVFGFSAFEMYHVALGQLNLAYSLLLPILGYIIVVWWQKGISTRTFVILAAVTMALQFYLFNEIFADMTGFLAVSLVAGFVLAGRADRPAIARLAKFIGLAYVIAIVLALPFLLDMLLTKPPRSVRTSGMDLYSLVIPRIGRTYGITWLTHTAAGPNKLSWACYVGIPMLVLVVLLAVTTWRSRLVRFLTCMLVVILVTSLGPVLYVNGHRTGSLPWAGVFYLPLVRNAYPLRMMVFAFLVLAVATAVWLAGPAKRVRWARWPLTVLAIVIIGLDAFPMHVRLHNEVPTFVSSGEYRYHLYRGEIVLVISDVGNAGMLWQADSGFYMKISGGYINEGITHRFDIPHEAEELSVITPGRVVQFERFVRTNHIGAVLLDTKNAPVWVHHIFGKMGLIPHKAGSVVIYPTYGCKHCRNLDRKQLGLPPRPRLWQPLGY